MSRISYFLIISYVCFIVLFGYSVINASDLFVFFTMLVLVFLSNVVVDGWNKTVLVFSLLFHCFNEKESVLSCDLIHLKGVLSRSIHFVYVYGGMYSLISLDQYMTSIGDSPHDFSVLAYSVFDIWVAVFISEIILRPVLFRVRRIEERENE
ncbi:hypothetical protein [Magnetofaba australis]|uniref:hypothetical protein n=1 Tax=Magnetofaba australis TaxID=1472297 RepID=UPI00117FCB7F|nr:hypothetical protein [Magnetofaba australis]